VLATFEQYTYKNVGIAPGREPHKPAILRQRLQSTFHDFSVTRSANLGVTVVVHHASAAARGRILAASRSFRLYFYDWETNALTTSGRSVASQLPGQEPRVGLVIRMLGLSVGEPERRVGRHEVIRVETPLV